ncbi:MAG: response regulator [Phycisphaeraceae bacterium]
MLVVDDVAIVREPVAAALREQGYQTVCAVNGREALVLANQCKPDLILLDLHMPGAGGLEMLRALRGDPALERTPVLVLSELTDKASVIEAGRLGIEGYLLKSRFTLKDMLHRVEAALGTGLEPGAALKDVDETNEHTEPSTIPSAARQESVRPHRAPGDERAAHLKELKPVLTRSQMQEHLDNCGELKALSPTVARVLKMTQSAECSMDAVAAVIKQDQAISLKLLKLANSSVYARGEPVDTVQRAVMRIGLEPVRQMVLNLAVVERFSDQNATSGINMMLFWEHSIAVGLIATELTKLLGGKEIQIEAAFTMGLLHDVGRLVYVETLGETYQTVLAESEHLRLPLEQVESRLLLINHAEAMDRILHAWNFPKELINPIALHHLSIGNIRRVSPRSLKEIAILALADRLAHAMCLGSSGNTAIYPTVEFAQALNVTNDMIGQIADHVPEQSSDLKFAMLSNAPNTADFDVKRQLRQGWDGPFRPLCISPDPGIDASQLLCRRLADTATDLPPSVIVVEITHPRCRASLTTQLLEAQAQANLSALPLILLSPGGDLELEERAMTGRTIWKLAQPTALADWVDAQKSVNESSPPSRAVA